MSMTVGELIESLKGLDPDTLIILQKDAEGNGYSPLSCYGMGTYVAESTWSGDVYDEEWDASDCCMDDDEFSDMRNSNPRVLILAPVN